LLFAIAFAACNEQEDLVASEPEFVDVVIPELHKSHNSNGRTSSANSDIHEIDVKLIKEDGTEVLGKMRFTMPDQKLEKFEMTDNLFDETGLEPDFWVDYKSNSTTSSRSYSDSCIADCHDEFTDDEGNKIKGRGWCKAGCWAKTAAKVAAAAAAVIVAVNS